jgi:hypothetical protein
MTKRYVFMVIEVADDPDIDPSNRFHLMDMAGRVEKCQPWIAELWAYKSLADIHHDISRGHLSADVGAA